MVGEEERQGMFEVVELERVCVMTFLWRCLYNSDDADGGSVGIG